MEPLTPIPTPASQRWREFRIQALPVITFIAIVACIAILWQRYVFPSNIVAQVEPIAANIISTMPGTIQDLRVTRFQKVTKGEIIALLSVAETNFVTAALQAANANMQVMRARIELGQLRGDQVYEREKMKYMEERVELAVTRVNAKLAEATFRIQEELLTNTFVLEGSSAVTNRPLINTNQYNKALYEWQMYVVKVKETEQYLAEKEHLLPKLLSESTNTIASIEADIKAQQEKLLAETTNLVLRAPIDGVVSIINNRAGERVMAGAPIAVVTSEQSERIIAYMRQPISALPKPGDTLQIRRRTFKRQAATATVRDVGTQLEPIIPALAVMTGQPTKIDLGLPFAINLPPNFGLIPGEIVDIIYNPKR